jgi:hypothetical protein
MFWIHTFYSSLSEFSFSIFAEKYYILIYKLSNFALRMVSIGNLSIQSDKEVTILNHLLFCYLLGLILPLFLLIESSDAINFCYDFFLFFINNKSVTFTLFAADSALNTLT